MAPDPAAPPAKGRTVLAALVFAIGGIDTVLWLGWVALFSPELSSGEALSRSIASGVIILATVPWLLLTVPGLILAWRGKLLPLALMLVLAAPAVAALSFSLA